MHGGLAPQAKYAILAYTSPQNAAETTQAHVPLRAVHLKVGALCFLLASILKKGRPVKNPHLRSVELHK